MLQAVDPIRVFGKDPSNYDNSRADYPPEFLSDVLRDMYRHSELVPVDAPPQVTDIGAGTGKLGRVFAKLGCTVTYVEPNPRFVRFLENFLAGSGAGLSGEGG